MTHVPSSRKPDKDFWHENAFHKSICKRISNPLIKNSDFEDITGERTVRSSMVEGVFQDKGGARRRR